MVLFDYNHIISLIISACKIYSNVLINHVQIVDFIETIDKENTLNLDDFFNSTEVMNIPEYIYYYYYSSNSATYSIKAFTQFIKNSVAFKEKFDEIQFALLKYIFPVKYQQRILKRYNFYTLCHKELNTEAIKNSIPKENCMDKIERILLSEPKPYHFDYCISPITDPDFNCSENYIDTLVLLIKQAYGYGYRSSRSSKFLANRQVSDLPVKPVSRNNSHTNLHNSRNSHIGTASSHSPLILAGNRASRKHTLEKNSLQRELVKRLSESLSPSSSRELTSNNSNKHQVK